MKKEFSQYKPSTERLTDLSTSLDDREFCYEALKKVSRSFAVVIQQLPEQLQDPVCLFYLVLRGLDTVEDDMSIPQNIKEDLLINFADKLKGSPFTLSDTGDTEDYRDLMLHFDKVCNEFHKLDKAYQDVIADITYRMAVGMNKYATQEVNSYTDWDDYCHYVAGLVGIGLSDLFMASGLEDSEQLKDNQLANEMGLFLQKTNIIRDFAEDLEQERVFWPSAAWNKRVENLSDLQKNPEIGLEALNELIINALQHIPNCLKYLTELKDVQIFRFCAIPQLMAIATLGELFSNEDVLYENVKIRKGKTAKYFMSIKNFDQTKREFIEVLKQINKADKTQSVTKIIEQL
jgi:farnesyl-diphosphate farnesyltransferase